MKIVLEDDDNRKFPSDWIRVRWPEEAIELLKTNQVEMLSLDMDLGDDNHGCGYDVILFIEREVALNNFVPPEIRVHSSNPCGRQRMEAGIESIKKLFEINKRNQNGSERI